MPKFNFLNHNLKKSCNPTMIWEKWNSMSVEWVGGSNPGNSRGEVLFAEVSCGRPNASFAAISLSLGLSTTPSPPTRPPLPTHLGKAKKEDALNPLLLSALSVGCCWFHNFFWTEASKQATCPVLCCGGREEATICCMRGAVEQGNSRDWGAQWPRHF